MPLAFRGTPQTDTHTLSLYLSPMDLNFRPEENDKIPTLQWNPYIKIIRTRNSLPCKSNCHVWNSSGSLKTELRLLTEPEYCAVVVSSLRKVGPIWAGLRWITNEPKLVSPNVNLNCHLFQSFYPPIVWLAIMNQVRLIMSLLEFMVFLQVWKERLKSSLHIKLKKLISNHGKSVHGRQLHYF